MLWAAAVPNLRQYFGWSHCGLNAHFLEYHNFRAALASDIQCKTLSYFLESGFLSVQIQLDL